jgi:cytochrome c-type biogenesis protein CcmH/NrfG
MAGSAAYERRDFADAASAWRRLLAQVPNGTAEHAQLSAAVQRAERLAQFALPAPR